jgi:hypothetical protein
MIITDIKESPKLTKRFRAKLSNGQEIDFGLDGASTYIDHKDELKRRNYWARHFASRNERHLIYNLIPSPSLLSAYLLWGKSTSLRENIIELNKMLESKYGGLDNK